MGKYLIFFLLVFYANASAELTGKIVRPGDADYDKARLVANYNASKNLRPEFIVYCQNVQDVQNAVNWAREQKLPIRIRSGGHNHEAFSSGTKVALIDVSQMKKVELDKEKNIAKIEPGINNLELYTRLNQDGLTHVGGTCADVALSGLTLSGGMGPLLRREGLTCDRVIAFEMVDANGKVLHVTKDNEHKDLFWALCGGGGGNFGVVTSLTIKVYPATPVTWFNIGWDWDQPVEKVIQGWQDFFGKPDRNWFSHLDVWAKAFPTEKVKKMPVKALGMFWGSAEEAKNLLAPLLSIGKPKSLIKEVTWDESIKLIEESTAVFLTDKPEYKSTGAFANEKLPPEATKMITDTLQNTTAPLFNVLLFSMGGASGEVAPTDTAYFYRKAKFFINYSIQWLEPENEKKQRDEIIALRTKLLPYTVGDYIGNPDMDLKDYLRVYFGDNVERLIQVKSQYDPQNLFNFPQSIPVGI